MRRLLFLLIPTLFFSCLVYEQGLTINSDGSADLKISYSLEQDVHKNLLELQKASKKDAQTLSYFDEGAIKAHLDSFPSIENHRIRVYTDNKKVFVDLKINISNLRQALDAGLIPYARLYKNGDNWRFMYSTPHDMTNIQDEESKKRLKGLDIKLKISTPSEIVSTNGEKKGDEDVLWNFSPEAKSQASELPSTFFVEFKGEKISFD